MKPLVDRVWPRVRIGGADECWPWLSTLDRKGYGIITRTGKRLAAHRVTYELLVGPIPPGLTLDHLCRNHSCVNPRHLEPVTRRENVLRGDHPNIVAFRTNRCPRGHAFTEANTYVYPGTGKRACHACRAAWRGAHR